MSGTPCRPDAERAAQPQRGVLGELAWLFLKLGTIAFGGPAAHFAMMEDEVVRRRRWLTREEFVDLLGATNLIPGPNSTELAIHIGHARAGWPGLLVAGTCFILPATLIVTGCAWAYVHLGRLPEAAGILYGVKPVVIAVVLQALWRLGCTAIRGPGLAVLALAAAGANALGADELAVLGGAALLAGAAHRVRSSSRPAPPAAQVGMLLLALLLARPALAMAGAGAAAAVGLGSLFAFFLKVGSVLFGSGYVLLAFLRGGLVHDRGWLTESQLLDAVAIGQVTPGPVFTTATFIGYVLAGGPGAAAATVGIFLSRFRLRRDQRPARPEPPALTAGGRGARRCERRLARVDGSCDGPARHQRAPGRTDARAGRCERGVPLRLSRQLELARAMRCARRSRGPPMTDASRHFTTR